MLESVLYSSTIEFKIYSIKPIILEDPVDVVDKLHNDVITVTVGGQRYTFVSPEFDLDLVKSLK